MISSITSPSMRATRRSKAVKFPTVRLPMMRITNSARPYTATARKAVIHKSWLDIRPRRCKRCATPERAARGGDGTAPGERDVKSVTTVGSHPSSGGSMEAGAMQPTFTELAGYSAEVDAIRAAMIELAPSRLADTSAWVQTSWIVAQAEGALRRAASSRRLAPRLIEELAVAVQSARAALRDLESLAG